MRDGGEENNISCARSDTEGACVIYWIESLRNPGGVYLYLKFGKLCFGNETYKFSTLFAVWGLLWGEGCFLWVVFFFSHMYV